MSSKKKRIKSFFRRVSPRSWPLFLAWTLLVIGVTAWTAHYLTQKPEEKSGAALEKPLRPKAPQALPKKKAGPEPEYAALPPKVPEGFPAKEPTPPVSVLSVPSAKVAIIIDDLGPQFRVAKEFLDLKEPITMSILPHQRYSREIAARAREKNRDVLLHLPMEPYQYPKQNPGKGALLVGLSPEELERITLDDLESVPYIVGVNNHMGSRFTEEKEGMEIVLEKLKEKNLFFVDSRTTPHTTGYSLGKSMGLRVAQRDVFLDNDPTEAHVEGQLNVLVKTALAKGSAIGIGHPYRATVSVLRRSLPRLREQGIEVVPVSQLVD